MSYVEVGCRCLIGLVFALAAAGKLRSRAAFGEFVESLRAMRLLSGRWIGPAATAVVIGEVLTVVLVATPGALAAFGFACGAALLTAFAAGIATARRRGARPRCRCFGARGAELSGHHVVRNLVLAALALLGLVAAVTDAGGTHPGGLVVAVVTGGLLAVLATAFDDLLFAVRPTTLASGLPGRNLNR
jgi:hypothetical protein